MLTTVVATAALSVPLAGVAGAGPTDSNGVPGDFGTPGSGISAVARHEPPGAVGVGLRTYIKALARWGTLRASENPPGHRRTSPRTRCPKGARVSSLWGSPARSFRRPSITCMRRRAGCADPLICEPSQRPGKYATLPIGRHPATFQEVYKPGQHLTDQSKAGRLET